MNNFEELNGFETFAPNDGYHIRFISDCSRSDTPYPFDLTDSDVRNDDKKNGYFIGTKNKKSKVTFFFFFLIVRIFAKILNLFFYYYYRITKK